MFNIIQLLNNYSVYLYIKHLTKKREKRKKGGIKIVTVESEVSIFSTNEIFGLKSNR